MLNANLVQIEYVFEYSNNVFMYFGWITNSYNLQLYAFPIDISFVGTKPN